MGFDDGQATEVLAPLREDRNGSRAWKERAVIWAMLATGFALLAAGILVFDRMPRPLTPLECMVRDVWVVTNGPSSYQVRYMLWGLTNWVTATNEFDTAEAAMEALGPARKRVGIRDDFKKGFVDGLKKGLGGEKE